MRRIILGFIVFMLTLAFTRQIPQQVYAAEFDPLDAACASATGSVACDRGGAGNPDPIGGRNGIIQRIAGIISIITGIASVILIIIGTIKYITAAGDSNSINSAKKTILYALIGIVVTIFAQGIIIFVINRVN